MSEEEPRRARRAQSSASTPRLHSSEEDAGEDHGPFRHIEIVGLLASSNGRSCGSHLCCGKEVVVGDIFRLQKTVISQDDGYHKDAFACILVRGGSETCRVAFLPRVLVDEDLVVSNVNKHMQVVELYEQSKNHFKRRVSHQNYGMAGCIFLAEIPQTE